jgi:REP element-mobilizing transposase RayT
MSTHISSPAPWSRGCQSLLGANFVEIIFDSWQFLQKERGVPIFGYVLLENHLHWIASGHDLSDQVSRFKSYTARRIIRQYQGL